MKKEKEELHDRPPPTPGARVKAARLALGLSQAELAQRAGLDQSSLSGYERGRPGKIARGNLVILALALGLDPGVLDPSLAAVVLPYRPRGRAVAHPLSSEPGHWSVEYQGLEGPPRPPAVLPTSELGWLIASLALQGITFESIPIAKVSR